MHTIDLQPRGRKTVSAATATGRKAMTAVTAITQVMPEDQTQPKTYTATVVKRYEARAEVTFEATGPVNSWDLAEALKGRLTDADFGAPVSCGDIYVECVEEAEPGEKSAARKIGRKANVEIRDWLIEKYNAEDARPASELDDESAGVYAGESDSWLVLETIPNTNEFGWFFAGHEADILADIASGSEE